MTLKRILNKPRMLFDQKTDCNNKKDPEKDQHEADSEMAEDKAPAFARRA